MTRLTHVVRQKQRRVARDTEEPAWPSVPAPRRALDSCTDELLDEIDEALGT